MSRGGEGQLILRIGDGIGEGCLVVVKRHIRGRRGGVDGEADGIAVGGEVQCALRDECPRLPISVPSLDHEGCRVPRVAVTGRVHPHALDHGVRPGGNYGLDYLPHHGQQSRCYIVGRLLLHCD